MAAVLLQWQGCEVARDHLGHKTENSYCLALRKRSIPTSRLEGGDSQCFHPSTPNSQVNHGTAQDDHRQAEVASSYPEMFLNVMVF